MLYLGKSHFEGGKHNVIIRAKILRMSLIRTRAAIKSHYYHYSETLAVSTHGLCLTHSLVPYDMNLYTVNTNSSTTK